jgi:hypothetical protein
MTSLPEEPDSWVTCLVLATPKCGYWGPGCVLSWVIRRRSNWVNRWGNHARLWPSRGIKGWCGSCLDLVCFKLVVPPLQPWAMRPYLMWGTWFPSHLPLEGTRSYTYLLGHNRWPAVPRIQDSNTDAEWKTMWSRKPLEWTKTRTSPNWCLNFFYVSLYSTIGIKEFYKLRWGQWPTLPLPWIHPWLAPFFVYPFNQAFLHLSLSHSSLSLILLSSPTSSSLLQISPLPRSHHPIPPGLISLCESIL